MRVFDAQLPPKIFFWVEVKILCRLPSNLAWLVDPTYMAISFLAFPCVLKHEAKGILGIGNYPFLLEQEGVIPKLFPQRQEHEFVQNILVCRIF